MSIDVDALADDFADELENGAEAIFSTLHGGTALRDKPLDAAGVDVCGWLAWIRQNTPFYLDTGYRLTESGPVWNCSLVRQSDNKVVRSFRERIVTGSLNGERPGDYLHDRLKRIVYRLAKKLEAIR